MPQSWYAINKLNDTEAEVRIYEDIGFFGVSAKSLADELENIEADTIHVRLNSYGGEAFDGIAIQNSLEAHSARIIMHIDGIAASAASIIAMAGDEIRMADNAMMMIHEANGGVYGEAGDMRKYADTLDKLNDSIATTYQKRAGKTRKYWRGKMAEESWFTAEEAKAEGLADAIDQPQKAAQNRFDFKIYNLVKEVPEAVRRVWAKTQTTTTPETPPRGDAPPEISTKEVQPMADTTVAPPASIPAAVGDQQKQEVHSLNAQVIQAYIDKGKGLGVTEARQQEHDRMKDIFAACPGNPLLAINAFLGGQNAATVKLAYDAAQNATADAQAQLLAKDKELARLQLLAATGGYPGGVASGVSMDNPAQMPEGLEPKAQAQLEWDSDPMIRAQNGGDAGKSKWLLFREHQLSGGVRVLSRK